MLKKLHCTVILIIMTHNILLCQNIVYNGSFEDYSICPNNLMQLNRETHWFSANWGGGGSGWGGGGGEGAGGGWGGGGGGKGGW